MQCAGEQPTAREMKMTCCEDELHPPLFFHNPSGVWSKSQLTLAPAFTISLTHPPVRRLCASSSGASHCFLRCAQWQRLLQDTGRHEFQWRISLLRETPTLFALAALLQSHRNRISSRDDAADAAAARSWQGPTSLMTPFLSSP